MGWGALAVVLLAASGCGDGRAATMDAGRDSLPADTSAPDADAIGGDASDAGTDGDGGGSSSCVSVTGGGMEPWLDLQIAGRQFDAYEGRRIRIVVSNTVGGRLGVAEATIASGAFELAIPGTLDYGVYPEIALYIDDDANSACDVGEPLWGFVTGIVQESLRVDATPAAPCLSGGGPNMFQGCDSWLTPTGPCVINGQPDLHMRLSCPP